MVVGIMTHALVPDKCNHLLIQYLISPSIALCVFTTLVANAFLFSAAGSWNYRGPQEEAHPGPASTSLKDHLPPHVSGRLSESHQDPLPPREPAKSASHHGVRAFN